MAKEPSAKQKAWPIFDRIVASEMVDGRYTSPWVGEGPDATYKPDYGTLTRLLGVPLFLKANSQTGVPAIALDVWIAYELRRAGFSPDAIWPRDANPRVVPTALVNLAGPNATALTKPVRHDIWSKLGARPSVRGVTASTARILGKNYIKHVDVVMSDWMTGPEILISTKRMDSSFGNNAANRVEESYGDAKNLRQRHPLSALGFVYAIRSTVLDQKPNLNRVGWADWLIDLTRQLGHEEDAYHSTCYLVLEWDRSVEVLEPADTTSEAHIGDEEEEILAPVDSEITNTIRDLPVVTIRFDAMPPDLRPDVFLRNIIGRVLENTPVELHSTARTLRDGDYQRQSYPPPQS
jgi:hypothetical protein